MVYLSCCFTRQNHGMRMYPYVTCIRVLPVCDPYVTRMNPCVSLWYTRMLPVCGRVVFLIVMIYSIPPLNTFSQFVIRQLGLKRRNRL